MAGIFIERVSASDLKEMIADVMEGMIRKYTPPANEQPKYLTRQETAKLLRISLPTLNEYTKRGTLKGYRLQGRVLYREDEILSSLQEIVTAKHKRGVQSINVKS